MPATQPTDEEMRATLHFNYCRNSRPPSGIYMQVKLLTQLTTAEVRQIARSAANSDESLDTANVFPIGTDRHAVFTTEYLSQLSALEEVAREPQRSFPLDCFPNDQDRAPDVLARKGTGLRDP